MYYMMELNVQPRRARLVWEVLVKCCIRDTKKISGGASIVGQTAAAVVG